MSRTKVMAMIFVALLCSSECIRIDQEIAMQIAVTGRFQEIDEHAYAKGADGFDHPSTGVCDPAKYKRSQDGEALCGKSLLGGGYPCAEEMLHCQNADIAVTRYEHKMQCLKQVVSKISAHDSSKGDIWTRFCSSATLWAYQNEAYNRMKKMGSCMQWLQDDQRNLPTNVLNSISQGPNGLYRNLFHIASEIWGAVKDAKWTNPSGLCAFDPAQLEKAIGAAVKEQGDSDSVSDVLRRGLFGDSCTSDVLERHKASSRTLKFVIERIMLFAERGIKAAKAGTRISIDVEKEAKNMEAEAEAIGVEHCVPKSSVLQVNSNSTLDSETGLHPLLIISIVIGALLLALL